MSSKIQVAILEDHQSIIDGYILRLNDALDIEVVATACCGEELELVLAGHAVDVLLLDIGVPVSPENPSPYPILNLLPNLLQSYPNLTVIVISVYHQGTLLQAVVDAGASGYILKDDRAAIQDLSSIIHSVSNGGVYFSHQAYRLLAKRMPKEPPLTQRQLEALSLCAAYPDVTLSELAKKFCVANSTMRNMLSEVYLQLGVGNRTAAVMKARRLGLITPADPVYGL